MTRLRVAGHLDDPDLAAMLLAPFRVETLAKGHAALAAGVVARYGQVWAENLVRVWYRDGGWPVTGGTDRRAWLTPLPSLCGSLCDHSADGKSIAAMLVAGSWARLRDEIDGWARGSMPSRRVEMLGALGPSVAAVLAARAVSGAKVPPPRAPR